MRRLFALLIVFALWLPVGLAAQESASSSFSKPKLAAFFGSSLAEWNRYAAKLAKADGVEAKQMSDGSSIVAYRVPEAGYQIIGPYYGTTTKRPDSFLISHIFPKAAAETLSDPATRKMILQKIAKPLAPEYRVTLEYKVSQKGEPTFDYMIYETAREPPARTGGASVPAPSETKESRPPLGVSQIAGFFEESQAKWHSSVDAMAKTGLSRAVDLPDGNRGFATDVPSGGEQIFANIYDWNLDRPNHLLVRYLVPPQSRIATNPQIVKERLSADVQTKYRVTLEREAPIDGNAIVSLRIFEVPRPDTASSVSSADAIENPKPLEKPRLTTLFRTSRTEWEREGERRKAAGTASVIRHPDGSMVLSFAYRGSGFVTISLIYETSDAAPDSIQLSYVYPKSLAPLLADDARREQFRRTWFEPLRPELRYKMTYVVLETGKAALGFKITKPERLPAIVEKSPTKSPKTPTSLPILAPPRFDKAEVRSFQADNGDCVYIIVRSPDGLEIRIRPEFGAAGTTPEEIYVFVFEPVNADTPRRTLKDPDAVIRTARANLSDYRVEGSPLEVPGIAHLVFSIRKPEH